MEGFLAANHKDSWNEALREVKELHESGQLTVLEDLRDGLASAPTALIEMLAGKNVGQLAVRLVPDPVGWRSEKGGSLDANMADNSRANPRGRRASRIPLCTLSAVFLFSCVRRSRMELVQLRA